MSIKIDPAEGYGAHRRSVRALSEEVQVVRNIAETAAGGGVEEAPIDGTPYVRQDGSWVSPIDLGYNTIGNFFDITTQVGILDTPKTVLFGAGGSAGDHITVASNGEITVVNSGYYAFKQRFRAGREGASGTSDLFFYAEISVDNGSTWNIIGNSVDLSMNSSKELTVFFDIATIYLSAGVKLRNRFARSGDNSGDLIAGTPSAALDALGVPVAPSAQITIYKI